MIKSMTGYGEAKVTAGGFELSVEMKSVNNRYLDVTVRMPRSYLFAEEALKAIVQGRVSRGKIDVFVGVDSSGAGDVLIKINEPLAEGYVAVFNELTEKYGVRDELTAALLSRFPDVLQVEKKETDREAVTQALCAALSAALDEFDNMRAREGDKLKSDLLNHVEQIERLTLEIETRSPATVEEYRVKLETKVRELLDSVEIDSARLISETVIFADRVAVDEEIVRLGSHVSQLRELLSGSSPVGRKLDFLIQELNREANTIGSKCNDLEISRYVIDLKSEIEKIREQVQNIE